MWPLPGGFGRVILGEAMGDGAWTSDIGASETWDGGGSAEVQ